MEFAILPLGFGPARLTGLSKRLITSYHANNHTGAVKRLNAIHGRLSALDFGGTPGFQLGEPLGCRPHGCPGRGHSHPGARHVRAS